MWLNGVQILALGVTCKVWRAPFPVGLENWRKDCGVVKPYEGVLSLSFSVSVSLSHAHTCALP